jgi:hypothetical protein
VSTATIEQLKRIMADESRPEQERQLAAEHILKLQQPAGQEPAPAADDLDQIRRIFAQMRLSPEQIEADEDERVARENAVRKACPECYQCQAIGNASCDLCGHEPDRWLPGVERSPRQNRIGDIIDENGNVVVPSSRASGAHVEAHAGRQWRRWASTNATVAELTHIVSRFSAPDADWKVQHAALVLKLLGHPIPVTFWGQTLNFGPPSSTQGATQVAADPKITDEQVRNAIQFLDLQLARLRQQAQQEPSCPA